MIADYINVIRVGQMGYIQIDDPAGNLAWNKDFSLLIQFRLSEIPDYVILLQKDDLLKIEICEDKLLVSGSGIIQRVFDLFTDEFCDYDQKTISVTYKDGLLRVMYGAHTIMILRVMKRIFDESTFINNNPIKIAEFLGDYLYYVRIFSRALTVHEIVEQTTLPYLSDDTSDLYRQISAISGEISCIPGENQIEVVDCVARSLTACYEFGMFGNILPHHDLTVNPGGEIDTEYLGEGVVKKSTHPYTVSAIIRFEPRKQLRYYIFSNNFNEIDSGMSLYIQKDDDGNHYVISELGNSLSASFSEEGQIRTLKSTKPIIVGEWTTITTSYDNGKLYLYFDGEEVGNKEIVTSESVAQDSNVIIGDKQIADDLLDSHSFSGYIKSIYVFNECVSLAEWQSVDTLDVYQADSLVAAYEAQSFHDKNQVSSADIFISRGVTSVLMEDIVQTIDVKQYVRNSIKLRRFDDIPHSGTKVWHERKDGMIRFKYLCPYKGEIVIDEVSETGLSAETIWQIELILTVIIGVTTCLIGLKVSPTGKGKIVGKITQLIGKPQMKAAIQMLIHDTSWDSIIYIFKIIYQAGLCKALLLSLFEISVFTLLSVVAEILAWVTGIKAVAVGAGIVILFASIVLVVKKRPSIRLKSIKFCHSPRDPEISSVYIRSSIEHDEPDYIADSGIVNNVLYLSNYVRGQVELVVSFDVNGDGVYTVEMNNRSPFGRASVIGISKSNSTVHFVLNNFTGIQGICKKEDVEITWTGYDRENQINLGSSSHHVYILPSIPLDPICTDVSDRLTNPYCQLLDMVFDHHNNFQVGDNMLQWITECVYNYRYYKYAGQNAIARVSATDHSKIAVDIGLYMRYLTACINGSCVHIPMNCVAISSILFYLACLFLNNRDKLYILEFDKMSNCSRAIKLVGENSRRVTNFYNHFIVVKQYEENTADMCRVYDGCLKYPKMELQYGLWQDSGHLVLPINVPFSAIIQESPSYLLGLINDNNPEATIERLYDTMILFDSNFMPILNWE